MGIRGHALGAVDGFRGQYLKREETAVKRRSGYLEVGSGPIIVSVLRQTQRRLGAELAETNPGRTFPLASIVFPFRLNFPG